MAHFVENILERNAIDTRPGPRDTIIKICCPFCGNAKYKCYVYEDQAAFHCFRCWEGGAVWKLFKQMGIEYNKGEETRPSSFTIAAPPLPEKRASLWPEGTKILLPGTSKTADMAIDYLADRRGLSSEEMNAYDIRYCPTGPLAGNIIFPIKNRDGEMVSWQAKRYMLAGNKNDNPTDGPGKSELLYGIDKAPVDSVLVIVEGPLDVIALNRLLLENGFGAVGIFGHVISKMQAMTLRVVLNPLWVYIMFDSDVSEEETKMAGRTLRMAGVDDIRMCKLTKGDPDDLTPAELQEQLCNAKPYEGV